MATLGAPLYYKNGSSGYSSVIGYESKSNRVVRFSFKTGSTGATSISISVTAGTISNQQGDDLTSIPFYVTTSSTSHADANGADGVAVTGYIRGSSGKAYSGSAPVVLKADTTYYLWFFPGSKTYGWSYWHNNSYYYTDCTPSGTSKFALSISAGTGSTITVNRTSSSVGLSTGNLSNGAVIYKNDKLKITFAPKTNYKLLTQKMNGTTIASGNTHTVSGDISVTATAQVLASNVGATDANIGSTSTITVTKYNTNYYHTLQYSFGSLSGYITSSGGVQSSATRFKTTSIAFSIPTAFYAQIPNAKTGTCTITCKTYETSSSTTQLGNSTTCKITITAAESLCKPTVSGVVIDTNATTKALTGNEKTLIRYKSTAQCTITATAKNSATISMKYINDVAPTNNVRTLSNVSATQFVFNTTDSRGYSNSATVKPTVINYIALTCNPLISRPTPTGDKIVMTVSGNVYRGSFGAYTNTLTLRYRYKESGGSYGSWQTIEASLLTLGTSSYRSTSEIELTAYPATDENGETINPGFDYHLDYDFQVQVYDGAGGYTLSTVNKYVTVNRGIPVFDWGENDFNINVALMLNNVNILNIMYPVGAVYMHSSSTLPTVVSNVGTWTSVATGINGVYAWKRTA